MNNDISNKANSNKTLHHSPFGGLGSKDLTFIGTGKVGTALGVYFRAHGMDVKGYFSRSNKPAELAAKLTESKVFDDIQSLVEQSKMVWITTPDDTISQIVDQIDKINIFEQKIFIHTSGLLTTDVLRPLQEKGHQTYSIHPLLAFNDLDNAVKMLSRTTFFVETDEKNSDAIREIFSKTGNKLIKIKKGQKPAYHAAACVLSNYLVTLFHAANQLFEIAGVDEKELKGAENVLVESVLKNLQNKSPKDALTGPLKRGDVETVKKHLEVLEYNLPELTELYKVMGKETMRMISPNSASQPPKEGVIDGLSKLF